MVSLEEAIIREQGINLRDPRLRKLLPLPDPRSSPIRLQESRNQGERIAVESRQKLRTLKILGEGELLVTWVRSQSELDHMAELVKQLLGLIQGE